MSSCKSAGSLVCSGHNEFALQESQQAKDCYTVVSAGADHLLLSCQVSEAHIHGCLVHALHYLIGYYASRSSGSLCIVCTSGSAITQHSSTITWHTLAISVHGGKPDITGHSRCLHLTEFLISGRRC